jgi:hypothetical protein
MGGGARVPKMQIVKPLAGSRSRILAVMQPEQLSKQYPDIDIRPGCRRVPVPVLTEVDLGGAAPETKSLWYGLSSPNAFRFRGQPIPI